MTANTRVDSDNLRLKKVECTYTMYVIAYKDEALTEADVDESAFVEEVRVVVTDVDVSEVLLSPEQALYSPEVIRDLRQLSDRAMTCAVPEFHDDVKEDVMDALRVDAYMRKSRELNMELFKPGGDMTYTTVQRGDTGVKVSELQSALNLAARKNHHAVASMARLGPLKVDGAFGPGTEKAVMAFQKDRNLYVDGIAGPVTWRAIDDVCEGKLNQQVMPDKPTATWKTVKWTTSYHDGYNRFTLRTDVADVFEERILKPMQEAEALMTSSGSKRSLTAGVGANQSATSFHYLCTAFDLYVYSGMVNPHTDPFVITIDERNPRYWNVWARVKNKDAGRYVVLDAVTYEKSGDGKYAQKVVRVTDYFLNFTELAAEAGFQRIPRRPAFLDPVKKSNGAAEWWHFQYEADLVHGVTTYGSQLLRVYSQKDLLNTPPWKYRDLKFGTQWR